MLIRSLLLHVSLRMCPCRLRQDMESQAAALRSAVESQGREVAALRATAAAAEAESAAAKAELAQVCGWYAGAVARLRAPSERWGHTLRRVILQEQNPAPSSCGE